MLGITENAMKRTIMILRISMTTVNLRTLTLKLVVEWKHSSIEGIENLRDVAVFKDLPHSLIQVLPLRISY